MNLLTLPPPSSRQRAVDRAVRSLQHTANMLRRGVALLLLAHVARALDVARRRALRRAVAGPAALVGARCGAFENAIPESAKYADRTKRKGPEPKDLGVRKRQVLDDEGDPVTVVGLKECDGKPHCFSTTGDATLESRLVKGVDGLLRPWVPAAGDATPLRTVAAVVRAYEPGQNGVDGGGFKIFAARDDYLYAQFESLKAGWLDDVEFALAPSGSGVLVRSSARYGVLDVGVNAIRLNAIAAALRAKGWTIGAIDAKQYPDYFVGNDEARASVAGEQVKASNVFNR